jgi:isoaspartyl peptidase/L-asparaginase-like protein (Ntn-hydrolase superfamily)
MESNKQLESESVNIFARFGDRISDACQRAVREALEKHKRAGNPIAISRDGKVVILQPDEIKVGPEPDKT